MLWAYLAAVADAAGDAKTARAAIGTSLHHQPHAAQSWLMLANIEMQAERPDEAEAAFNEAIGLDPAFGAAHFGLGLLCFKQRQVRAAAACFAEAIARGYQDQAVFVSLGHAAFLTGDFQGAVAAFRQAAAYGPLDAEATRNEIRARAIQTIIAGDLDRAIADYPSLTGNRDADIDEMLRDAFAQLSAFGHRIAALAVGRYRLARSPEDRTQQYLLDAVSGHDLVRAPADYVESHFDAFAANFDEKLQGVLQYDVPRALSTLVANHRQAFGSVLDLGCGTGLAAVHLARFGGQLTGLDLAGRMLEKAGGRGRYHALVKAEAGDFLAANPGQFDLVFAADFLIYFGDLAEIIHRIAGALTPGGIFAASFETLSDGSYRLLPSGRFAHAPGYVGSLAGRHFRLLCREAAALRLEAGQPVQGFYAVFERC